MKKNKFDTDLIMTIIAFLFIFVSIFGYCSIMDLRIAGVVLTYYRVTIPILFIYILGQETLRKEPVINREEDRLAKYAYIVLIFWLVYGFISLFVSPWTVLNRGLKELLSLSLGSMSVYISVYLYNQNKFYNMILAVKISMVIVILIGYIEILTGWHLNTSMYSEYIGKDAPDNVFYIATGIFYNPNDYCAFLSIFSPVFLYRKYDKWFINLFSYIMLFFIFLILLIDDAWICIIAISAGCAIYLVLSKANILEYIFTIASFLFARYFGKIIVDLNNIIMYKLFGNETLFKHSITVSNIESTLNVQVENASQGQGSLYYRLNTYIEGMKEMVLQSKGLGLGPGSYQNYFADIAVERDMMVNPHSFWIEILVQYGAIVFFLFVALMLLLIIKLCQQYLTNKAIENSLIIAIGICFALASFAPSTFLMNSYYWIIIGIGIAIAGNPDRLE